MEQTINTSTPAILDVLPDAIIWVRPVMHQSEIVDFEVVYSNRTADVAIKHPLGSLAGLKIREDGVPSKEAAEANFNHFLDVYTTGQPKEYTFYAHHAKRYFETFRTLLDGGVLSATRDRRAQREAEKKEQQTRRTLQSIVENSPNGIVVYDAMRDEEGTIIDFTVRHYNKRINDLTGYTAAEREQLTFKQILQNLNAEEAFALYVKTVETGEPIQKEQYVAATNKWLSSSTAKLDDGFLSMLTDITELKHNQKELRQQSEYLNNILNTSLSAVATVEAERNEAGEVIDFCYKQVNNTFLKWLQRKQEDVKDQKMLEVFPNTKNTGIFDVYKKVIETGVSQQLEVHYYDELVDAYYDLSVAPLDESTAVGTFNDISINKKALNKIEHQKNLLDNILKYSSNGISVGEMIRDENGKVIDIKTIIANEAAINFTGIPREEYLSKTAAELDPGFTSSAYFEMCIKTMETGEPFLTQYFLQTIGRWMEVSVSKMDDDHQIYIFTDVTTIKEAQLAIEKSEKQLQNIINRTQSGIFTITPIIDANDEIVDFRFAIVNRALAAYVKQEPEAMIGQIGSKFFPTYKENGLFERFKNTFETGNTNRFDFHYHAQEIDAWIDMMCTRFDHEILVTFTDYTPVKKLQLELQKLVEELKRSNANLEEFAYAASHDLQEPLRKINFFSNRIKTNIAAQLDEENKRMFERMEAATTRMRTLIEDLLAYSQVSVKPEVFLDVDLNKTVQHVMLDLEATVAETNADIQITNLPQIKGDERQLRQLFQNLLSNSLKYHKEGVRPEIKVTSTINGKHPVINLLPKGSLELYHVIDVIDNGIGFEQEHAEKIFQVFQRLHGRSEYEGTGVGLAIVQKVVANHRGFISAQSQPGKGATFTILLPKEIETEE